MLNILQVEQKNMQPTHQQIRTNSVIRLPISELNNTAKYLVKWSRECPSISSSEFKQIFSREDLTKNTTTQYQCNPLDYGSLISATIIHSPCSNEEVVKDMHFGPVAMEDQLLKYVNSPDRFDIKIVVNKTSLLAGQVRFQAPTFPVNNNYKASVILSADNFQFELKIEKGIMMPPNSPFLKFYPREDNSLGISIFHQHPQLMEKLKAIQIFVHVGYYLKFYFLNRKFRDLFLFDLMQYFGLIQDMSPELQQPKIKINAVPELQKSSFGTQISNDGRKNAQNEKNREVDDEIYDLLYDRTQKLQVEEHDRELSFYNAAAFILSSVRKSGINKLKNLNMSKQKTQNSQRLSCQSKKLSPNKSNEVLDKKSYRGSIEKSERFVKKWSLENQMPTHHSPTHHHKSFFKSQENLTQQSQLRSTITKLSSQIDHLLKENRRLSQENKKLKEENIKWRYKQIKKTFKHTIRQKALIASKLVPTNARSIDIYKPIPSGSPSKVSSFTNLNKSKTQKSNNLLVVSKTTIPRENNVESPCSNGLSQPTVFYERNKNQINFTSCISVLNKEFVDEPSKKKQKKFIPRKRKIVRLNRSIESKNSKSQMNKSFEKTEEVPSTPFFTNMNGREAIHMKTHQSLFFRRYFPD